MTTNIFKFRLLFTDTKLRPSIVVDLCIRFIYLSYICNQANQSFHGRHGHSLRITRSGKPLVLLHRPASRNPYRSKIAPTRCMGVVLRRSRIRRRTAGDTCQPFTAGDVALIPPSMLHRWEYAPESADTDGRIRYLMAAFDHSLVKRCMETFPEVRNRLAGIPFPTDALKFGPESSCIIRKLLSEMTGHG